MVKVAMKMFVMVMDLEGKRKRGAFWDEITEIMFWKGGAAKGLRLRWAHVRLPPRKGTANKSHEFH